MRVIPRWRALPRQLARRDRQRRSVSRAGDLEPEPRLADVYRRLAAAEERHAGFWEGELRARGARVPERRAGWRARLLIAFARRFGDAAGAADAERPRARRQPRLRRASRSRAARRCRPRSARTRACCSRCRAARRRERGGAGALEGRHRAAGGNALRAAVLGANDGLVSNFSLVMGVAGAAGLGRHDPGDRRGRAAGRRRLDGDGRMDLGPELARAGYAHQLEIEAREIEEMPEEEREELALIYRGQGARRRGGPRAGRAADRRPRRRSTRLAREELGIDPDGLGGSAAVAAVDVVRAVRARRDRAGHPVLLPQRDGRGRRQRRPQRAGLFAIGARITVFTGRGALFSGGRQVVIGAAAATKRA